MNQKPNPYKNLRIEFHILQSFPVTCLNRDDVGAPKTAVIGGSTRARVSSQCWKRQVRLSLHDFGITLAVRTKKVDEMVAEEVVALGIPQDRALAVSTIIAEALSKDTLHFFTVTEARAFAKYAQEKGCDPKAIDPKEIHKIAKKVFNPAIDGIDIALFGRMVAQATELNVQGAASFSHAISTHKVTNEVEFFTALDDRQDEPGSAHMGSLEFNSATYYRYVRLDLGQLSQTLGDDGLLESLEAFVKALYVAVPSARQATQAGASPWEFAKVLVRRGQALQVPFETAIRAEDGGYLQPSIEYLKTYLAKKERLAGSLYGKVAEFTYGDDEDFSIDDLVGSLKATVAKV